MSLQDTLLVCGILASLLKVGADILARARWKGYSLVSQSISELSAIGSPTRALVLPFELAYDGLMIAFSVGLWLAAGLPLLRGTAVFIAGNALISLLVVLLVPMRISADGTPSTSAPHVALMATAMVFFLLAIVLGGTSSHDWFRYYSYATLLAYVGLAVLRLLAPPRTSQGTPAVTIGAQERTMVLGYLLWVVALALHEIGGLGG